MDLSFYKTYFEAEKNHWWFKVRRNIVLSILKKYNISKTAKIFDFGCGSGYTVSFLQSEGYNAHGSDVSNEAIEYGKSKGIKNLLVNRLGDEIDYPENSFDVILALDVVEHIEDDIRILNSINKVLKTNGMAIITIPAYQFLHGIQGDVAHDLRRYTMKEITSKLEEVGGFVVLKKSYFNTFLFLAIAGVRLFSKIFGLKNRESDFDINNGFLNRVFYWIFNIESKILSYINFPFGVSLLMVLKKK